MSSCLLFSFNWIRCFIIAIINPRVFFCYFVKLCIQEIDIRGLLIFLSFYYTFLAKYILSTEIRILWSLIVLLWPRSISLQSILISLVIDLFHKWRWVLIITQNSSIRCSLSSNHCQSVWCLAHSFILSSFLDESLYKN